METGDGNFHTNYVSLQRNQWKSKKNRTIERTFNVRARFVFVVLNGVYSGRKRSIGGASRPRQCGDLGRKGRREEEVEYEAEEERIKPRGRFVLRPLSTTLKDQFLSETLENGSFPAACRASHNCDLRGTGAAATRWQCLDHSRRTIEQFGSRCPVRKSHHEIPSTGRSSWIRTSFGGHGSFIWNSSLSSS